jgi:hypothetical protein
MFCKEIVVPLDKIVGTTGVCGDAGLIKLKLITVSALFGIEFPIEMVRVNVPSCCSQAALDGVGEALPPQFGRENLSESTPP